MLGQRMPPEARRVRVAAREAAAMARSFTRSWLAALATLALATPLLAQNWGSGGSVPQFRADGPDADAYGRKDGYPMCTGLVYIDNLGCRVGAFSDFGTLFPSRVVRAPAQPSPLRRAAR